MASSAKLHYGRVSQVNAFQCAAAFAEGPSESSADVSAPEEARKAINDS